MTGKHQRPGALSRRRQRVTETSDYAAMLTRIIIGYGVRVGQDPAALAHLRDLEKTLRDAVNLGIYAANKLDDRPYSIGEIAAIMGISKQAVHKRVQLGEQAALTGGAPVRVADLRAARALILGQAGVADRTGSPRELQAGQGQPEIDL